jgi:hypothetical protein
MSAEQVAAVHDRIPPGVLGGIVRVSFVRFKCPI